MRPLRVVQIVNGLALNTKMGGAERFGVELARHLDRDWIDPIVVGLWAWDAAAERPWRELLAGEGIRTVVGAPKDDSRAALNFKMSMDAIRRQFTEPVDIIHSQCDFGDVAAIWLRRALQAQILVRTSHNELEWAKRPLRRWLLVKGIYPFVYDLECGVSTRAVDVLDRRWTARLLRKRGVVVYNAINTRRFGPLPKDDVSALKRALGIAPDAPVIGSVGRFSEQKGYRYFLEAAALLARDLPQARFVLVGSGETESALKTQADALNLGEKIIFTGARDDVETLLPIMDVFVSSSLWEGLPTVILEAMLAETPVVATAVAGTTELVEDGVTGALVPAADVAQLAAAVRSMLADPVLSAAMAQRGRDFVRARFDIEQIARQQEDLYRQLLAR
ncbi:MAG: glycosyltransferase [Caldilineaceae bacterium]|nr:glycosyltransferase [Caldilineaceae bacterium]